MILLDSVVEAARRLPPEQGGALLLGVVDFSERCIAAGTTDVEEPFGDDALLSALFGGMKYPICKSLAKQINGSKGGTAKAENAKRNAAEAEADEEQTASKTVAKPKPKAGKPLPKDKDKDKDKGIESSDDDSSGKPDAPPYEAIIGHLNERAGTRFRADSAQTRSMINGRFAEGYTLDDFIHVIDVKCAAWNKAPRPGGKDMRPYLRPKTLFAPGNFEGYVNEIGGDGGVDLGRYAKPEGEAF